MPRAGSELANLEFRQVSGANLPFESDRFDLITSFQVIEHIVDMDPYLSEIRRVLKPGGMAASPRRTPISVWIPA